MRRFETAPTTGSGWRPRVSCTSPGAVGIIDRDRRYGTATIRIFRIRDTAWSARRVQRRVCALMPHIQRALNIHRETVKIEAEKKGLAWALDG